jgi:deoxyribose-phosphate aldolase
MRCAELAQRIEHTALGPDVPQERVRALCEEAIQHGFYGVCVNPCHVALAKAVLKEKDAAARIKVVTVVGFPHGTSVAAVKAFEAERAIRDGADELDMVIHVAALKERDYHHVLEEILAVREETQKSPRPIALKVILETALLDDEQKVAGCILAKAAGADFVKTSTGFGPGGATVEDVKLLKQAVGEGMGVKAAGGIRDYETAAAMIEAGADRIGTSSGVQILEGASE